MSTDHLKVEKIQHPIKTRLLTVKRISDLNPSMRRITLTGDDLAGFYSAAFDDHVKLMVPDVIGEKPNVPAVGPTGLVFDESKAKPAMRDYTPRRYDPVTNELDIDFVLHHEGPATDWASHAEPGHFVGIGGPRGSFIIPTAFDWHLLIGDETAIPAIGRRLEELPATTKAIVVIQTKTEDAKIELASQCQLETYWVREIEAGLDSASALESAVRKLRLPEGEGYVWAGAEYSDVQAVRQYLTQELGIDKSRIRASSYWRKPTAEAQEQTTD
ncbi:siderophore-interacting protein [Paenalcaligenes niemegkensis]|uniref:siderophore-interacting protein n=1 Tax=Paenalcaligenes niemegkensis TaxID=2895469 RepID=UPI001EE90976|nr:siderophore-interacting protein [Paenalcaligenes niemegkensis]MCQ9616039.1 siderophore-interacting protein [Paenalcaligenes niemegkensis]